MTVIEEFPFDERKAIKELKRRMLDKMTTELYEDTNLFYRFLKARDFNVDHAEHMLVNHLNWRKEFKVDKILTDFEPKEVLTKYFPGCIIGFDKEGSPVKYYMCGNIDGKGIRKSMKFNPDLVKYNIQCMEREMAIIKEQSIKLGKEVSGSVFVVDFTGLTFSMVSDKKTISHAIYLIKMYQDNYPERLKSIYLINISVYFTLGFNILKVFVAASIMKKVRFYCTDNYKDDLLEIMDAEDLPAFLGGKKTDPDGNPRCLSFVNHAGTVPEKYFINKSKISFSKSEGVKKLIVRRSSLSEVKLICYEVGSMIEWQFETKSRDIGFGLYYQEVIGDRLKLIELVPLVRLETEEFPETGIHKCEKPGTYIILFDNSYSWMRSKEIYYRAVVTTPKEYEEGLKDTD